MQTPAISVEKLSKTYGRTRAVDAISFQVQAGEIFGLLGPNGAGKTTTLEILEGLRAPDSGIVRIAGLDPQAHPAQLRDVTGVQLQSGGLPGSMTPEEAIAFFGAYHGLRPGPELLRRFDLWPKRSTQYHALSTGQKRRLALILAILHSPQVLFLDEPTAGLDVASRSALHELIGELRAGGTAVLLATHDMAEAETLCDRLAILLNGRLVTTGTPLELTAAGSGLSRIAVQTSRQSLLTAADGLPAVTRSSRQDAYAIYFSDDIARTLPALVNQISRSGDTLIDLRVERPSLEERFLELTAAGQETRPC